ncbi:transposase [Eleftheria terrae]|uniref:transposase n=1 Tax=Eleftheria terrae TaxID=1597781 RepID=UPI00263BA99B|nr:transposase [Eleftheria terrae]WKB52877.1 transposase [Eleftheria terrae]
MNTELEDKSLGRRRRRRHSAEFKAEVVAACGHPGVSIAAVALSHGLNANLVRRWVEQRERGPSLPSALPAQTK